jgi:hypothetical protein
MTQSSKTTESYLQDRNDVAMLRGLAGCHFTHGGFTAAAELLELARLILPDDGATLVLLARVQARVGDLFLAATMMTKATNLLGKLSDEDLRFARKLCDRLESQPGKADPAPQSTVGSGPALAQAIAS